MDPTQLPLRDLHLPTAVDWWPLAPGWWVLLTLLATALAWAGYRVFARWRANRARRVALARLDAIVREYEANQDVTALGAEVSELLRRATLAYAARAEVAGLTGRAWLEWLDRGLPQAVFADGPGQAINTLPYRRPGSVSDADIDGLIDAVRNRIRTPLPEAGA